MKKYLNLFLVMLKIGAFTFGGGYAMVSLLEHEFVYKRALIDKDEFLDMVAIAESTPGPIAINAATYLGYKILGFLGSLISTIAVSIPSFVIIYIISLFLNRFMEYQIVSFAFKGIQVAVIYLIFRAGIRMLKQMKKNIFNLVILILVMISLILTTLFSINFSTVFYILISGVLGIFIYSIIGFKKEEEK